VILSNRKELTTLGLKFFTPGGDRMLLGPVFERFAEQTPACVAVRALMESALNAEALDELFGRVADRQYEHELLFSTCVDLMAAVVCRTHRSVNAAYNAAAPPVDVSIQALYDKLARVEAATSAELVRHTARRLGPVVAQMRGALPPLVPGYRVKILDGNHLTRTQRRLKALRDVAAGPLPGQTLVVFDPALGLTIDVACCEDGHAQERSLTEPILARVEADDLWVADRNFCTTGILFGIAGRGGCFAIRQHASTLAWQREGPRRPAGRCPTGALFEQDVWLEEGRGGTLRARRVTLVLDAPARDGGAEIHLMTNLPRSVKAAVVMGLYRKRWRIEGLFQDLTTILKCEVNTLGYPKAALFGFCVALTAGNVFAALRAALRAAHGAEKVEGEVSNYYLADEIAGTYRGMLVALPPEGRKPFGSCDVPTFANWLVGLAGRADLSRFRKSPRGPKKPRQRRTRFSRAKHISTAKLLAVEKVKKRHP
jgi:Transposase DDE domain